MEARGDIVVLYRRWRRRELLWYRAKFTLGLLLSYFVAGTQTASADGLDDKLPALDGLVRYGCSVQGPCQ